MDSSNFTSGGLTNTDTQMSFRDDLDAGDLTFLNENVSIEFQRQSKDYHFGFELGKGSYGKVLKGMHVPTNEKVAVKILSPRHPDRISKEITALVKLNGHENIVSVHGYFSYHSFICLAMEFINGSTLRKVVFQSRTGLIDYQAAKYVYQCADALLYCHDNSIIHRDLKPENVIVSVTDNIKIIDFGFCGFMDTNDKRFTDRVGTIEFLAPEIAMSKPYSKEVDYWCLGILLYECLTCKTPYANRYDEKKLVQARICNNEMVNGLDEIRDEKPRKCIRSLLHYDPKKRMTFFQFMEHRWILEMRQKAFSMSSKILK